MAIYNRYKASVQYNDFKGTVAADKSDNLSWKDLLPKGEELSEKEFIFGFDFGFNENSGMRLREPGIVLLIGEREGKMEIKPTREVEISIPLAEFFRYFKRFNVIGTLKDQDIITDNE